MSNVSAPIAAHSEPPTVRPPGSPTGPVRRPVGVDDLGHLSFVEQVFLPEVRGRGILTQQQYEQLSDLAHAMHAFAAGTAGPAQVPTTSPTSPIWAARPVPLLPAQPLLSQPIPTRTYPAQPSAGQPYPAGWPSHPAAQPAHFAGPPVPVRPPAPPTAPRPTSAFSRWWVRTRESIGSDLAVHGLAYLGVLLFFVGAFGLVAFAFGDVAPTMRTVAEIVITSAPFIAAALLLRRGAVTVGRALEVGGGLLLPVMLITSFLDGVGFPPDLTGPALVITLTGSCAVIGVGYALWSRAHPASGLRFLVAPMVWFTMAMATLGLGREIPEGKAVAVPGSAQITVVAVALVLTLVLARWRPGAALAAPTMTAAATGTLVIGMLAVLTWAAEDWPALPIAVTGVLLVAAMELLRTRLPVSMLNIVEPLWWGSVGLALVPGLGLAPSAAIGAVGFVLMIEGAGADHRPVLALALPAAGVFTALLAVFAEPWWAVAVVGAATAWAMVRRVAPFDVAGASTALDIAAGVMPLGLLLALGAATDIPLAVAAGAGLVLLGTAPATRPVLHRTEPDRFWRAWWPCALVTVAVAAVLGWSQAGTTGEQWQVAIAVTALAIVAALGPIPPVWRIWPVLGFGTTAWLMICSAAGIPATARAAVLGVAALALVVGAHLRQRPTQQSVSAGEGLAGHVLALVSLGTVSLGTVSFGTVSLSTGVGWDAVVVTGLATAGWAVTTVFDGRDRSPVGAALAGVGQPLRYLPPALAALGIPLTAALALAATGWLPIDSVWAPVVLAATAVGYALAARLQLAERVVRTLAWGAFVAGVGAGLDGAVTGVSPQSRPAAVGLAALICAVAILPARVRPRLATWAAWAAVAPLTGLIALEVSPWFAGLPEPNAAAISLLGVGGALLVGGAAIDLRFGPWVPRCAPRRAALWPPVVLGGLEVAAAVTVTVVAVSLPAAGWLIAAAAVLVLATGLLARAGLLGGVAVLLGWLTVLMVFGDAIEVRPWIAVLVVAMLLFAAEAAHRVLPNRTWWSRWDLALLVSAAPVALTALGAAVGGRTFALTSVLVGVQCWAVAARLHRRAAVVGTLGVVGTGLVLIGAAAAGSGWPALALLVLSVGLTVIAARTTGPRHLAFQLGGAAAAVAAWLAALAWFGWLPQQAVDVSAVAAGVLTLVAAALSRVPRLERTWALVWGAAGVAGATFVAVVSALAGLTPTIATQGARVGPVGQAIAPSVPVAMGLLLVTAALLLGAAPLGLGWLRDLAVLTGLTAAAVYFQALDVPPHVQVVALALVSACCAVVALVLRDRVAERVWGRQVMELGVATIAVATLVAVQQLPDRTLLVVGLAIASLQVAAIGTTLRVVAVQVVSPVLACGAWLTYLSTLGTDNPQWETMPIGLALLVVAALLRRDRAAHGRNVATLGIVTIEMIGIAFLVVVSFVQAVAVSVLYALLALLVGLLIAGWGVLTRVRRRLVAGAVVGFAALVVMVAVPLVRLLPAWSDAWLWTLIVALGLLLVVVATTLERGRAAVHASIARFEQSTADWE